MSTRLPAFALFWCVFAFANLSLAQEPGDATIIRVTSRIVYIDVVVHDSMGHVVRGLTQQDFRLFEDGKPQKIDYFAAHSYELNAHEQTTQRLSQALPQHAASQNQFSNIPNPGASPGAVNIILFDLTNTPVSDQIYARRQLLKFLKALPPEQQVALFILSDRLHMVQNFTKSSDQLANAAQHINPRDFDLIKSKAGAMQEIDTVAGNAKALDSGASAIEAAHMMEVALANAGRQAAIGWDTRARITLAALNDLARATSGYAGRKNLLWMSESFPLAVGAEMNDPNFQSMTSVPGSRETANALATARIAVYPINLLGLETNGVGVQTSGAGETSLGGGPSNPATGNILHPQMGDTLKSQFQGRELLRTQMNDLADQTGGEAFIGTNDFAGALHGSMVDGSNYYTLAYRPDNQNWNGQFRKVRVQLMQKGDSLSYRRGYLAYPDNPSTQNAAQELNVALQPDTPDSTMLALQSKVDLPDAQHGNVLVHSILSAAGLSLISDPDRRHRGQLLVMLVAFKDNPEKLDSQPDAPSQTSGVLKLDLGPAQYQSVLANGIAFPLQLNLPPGRYRLRLGVIDMTNGRLGTLYMPISVPATP
ncbi:MAG: VWA domain-containing protein [Acidobacteriaceae bacterium]